MGKKSNKNHRPNPEPFWVIAEPVLCFFCGKTAQFESLETQKDENGEIIGELPILNKSNFIRGKDGSDPTKVLYAHAACYKGDK